MTRLRVAVTGMGFLELGFVLAYARVIGPTAFVLWSGAWSLVTAGAGLWP